MNKEMLTTFLNKVIKIDRGGPESSVGKLLHATDDHITVLTDNDGIIFYKTQHIKSLTHNAKQEMTMVEHMQEKANVRQKRKAIKLVNYKHYRRFMSQKTTEAKNTVECENVVCCDTNCTSPQQQHVLLEIQYYALMMHAKRMYNMSKHKELTVHSQYLSLMKHAEKMYDQLKLQREYIE